MSPIVAGRIHDHALHSRRRVLSTFACSVPGLRATDNLEIVKLGLRLVHGYKVHQKSPRATRVLGLCESNEVVSPSAFPSDFLLYAYGNFSNLGYCCRRAMMNLLQSNLAQAAGPIAASSSFFFSRHGLRTRVFRLRAVPTPQSKANCSCFSANSELPQGNGAQA
jgi:hypothetical protein